VQLTSGLTGLEMCLCAVQNSLHEVQSTFLNWSNRRSTLRWCFPFKSSLLKLHTPKTLLLETDLLEFEYFMLYLAKSFCKVKIVLSVLKGLLLW